MDHQMDLEMDPVMQILGALQGPCNFLQKPLDKGKTLIYSLVWGQSAIQILGCPRPPCIEG